MKRRVRREREGERGRGKVWEWSRSGRREDEDANRAADPRGREGRVESGLPQQQQQQKKNEKKKVRSWCGGPPVAHLYALRISESVASLVTPRTSYSSSSLMANPPPHSLSLAARVAPLLSPLSSPDFRNSFWISNLKIKHAYQAATAFVWLAAQRCSRRPWRARRRRW